MDAVVILPVPRCYERLRTLRDQEWKVAVLDISTGIGGFSLSKVTDMAKAPSLLYQPNIYGV